jgi:hypothetical protein
MRRRKGRTLGQMPQALLTPDLFDGELADSSKFPGMWDEVR